MTRLWRSRDVVVNTSHKSHGVYGWEVRQVSADDRPRSEKSRSLNVSIELIYLNTTSKKKPQSNDHSVWCKLYIMLMCRLNWFIWIQHPKKSLNQTIILFDANYISCIEIKSIQLETLKELFKKFQNIVWIWCMWC